MGVVTDSACGAPFVLVVGDGDLGYSASLCTSGQVSPRRLVATTLENAEELQKRYSKAKGNLQLLKNVGATVLHGIDATALVETLLPQLALVAGFLVGTTRGTTNKHSAEPLISRAIFNFPHCPGGLKRLRNLVGGFVASVAPLLVPGGEISVTLCAGQGGTPADGERQRNWADSWQVPLLAARVGCLLVRVEPWESPEGYAPMREPGNRDCGGKHPVQGATKPFNLDGALVHVFARGERASLPLTDSAEKDESSLAAPSRAGVAPALGERLLATRAAVIAALVAELPTGWDVESSEQARRERRQQHSQRHPALLHLLNVHCTGSSELPDERREAVVEQALKAASARAEVCWQWRRSADEQRARLEVKMSGCRHTACFPTPSATKSGCGQWLIAASIQGSGQTLDLELDLEVLAMLRGRIWDRRLLATPLLGGGGRACAPLHPCLFQHNLRVMNSEPTLIDPCAVIDMLHEVCGDLLFDAEEIDREQVPDGERHWRLLFSSPHQVLHDRGAYAIYQVARGAVRQRLGLTLC